MFVISIYRRIALIARGMLMLKTTLILGAVLALSSCASQPAQYAMQVPAVQPVAQPAPAEPSFEERLHAFEEQRRAKEQEDLGAREKKLAMIEPFHSKMSDPTAHEECINYVKDNLLDPTSFQLTGRFEPDPLWLMFASSNPNEVQFSAKMLARNKGGNIAPFRASCYYTLNNGHLSFRRGFASKV